MTARQLREKYIEFFESKGHRRFPSGSLVPIDVTGKLDESLLFNGAGMIQFKPYFRGIAKPDHSRLVTCQKCVRTGDIEEVGDDTHLTFFEMLGNFSFGDYFKLEAIEYSWEFLTDPKWLCLDPARLSFTVFEDDDEAFNKWKSVGAHHVVRLGEESNYWPAGSFSKGPPGPCGPNSEMFYWVPSDEAPPAGEYSREEWLQDEGAGKWVEIWNDVFIQYEWQGTPLAKGYEKTGMPDLPFKSIDTGMGLDRTAFVLGGFKNVYETDIFEPIFRAIDLVAGPSRSWVSPTVSVGSGPENMPLADVAGSSRSWVSPTVPVGSLPIVPSIEELEIKKKQGANLPHWEAEGATYFVTFRLADSVPESKRQEWMDERERMLELEARGLVTKKESFEFVRLYSERVGQYLDAGAGSCLLREPDIADLVEGALKHFDEDRYDLYAWAVMPNHVHAVVSPRRGYELGSILHSWKSFTAHEINKLLSRKGEDVWMDESFDHLVRGEEDFARCVGYTAENPSKAGLADWRWSGVRGVVPDRTETVLDTHDRDGHATTTRARRIIADHVRTASFCIADGVLPANNGRGYVLRRLIRRAVLQGERTLGIKEPFFYRIFDGVLEAMGSAYPELSERREIIVETLKNEEDLFRRTLKSGADLLQEAIREIETEWTTDTTKLIPGELAFKLYGTFGFPLEVTQEIAAEHDIEVDLDGYEAALKADQALSRGAQGETSAYAGVNIAEERATEDAPATTEFLGYSAQAGTGKIVRVRPGEGKSLVALDRTPFYAESGGQTFDTGRLGDLKVVGVSKSNGVFWHEVEGEPTLGATVQAEVDADRRARVQRNHTATHLLQAALRQVLGTHVTQAGSAVGPDSLRFDFTHGAAMTEAQKVEVEQIVNEQALRNETVVTHADIPIAEAKARGAMALFGEKYGDKVRMVEIGDFSRELCGGTHVRTAAEIGLFKIISESSAASGVRRIEAITGEAAYAWVNDEAARLRESAELLKTNPREIVSSLTKTLDALRDERKRRERAELAALSGGGKEHTNQAEATGKVMLWTQNFGELDPKLAAQAIDNAAAEKPNQVTLGAASQDGKIQFICKVGPEALTHGAHAGNLLREVAKIAGGGGGGRADFATAGGRLPEKVDEALAVAKGILEAL